MKREIREVANELERFRDELLASDEESIDILLERYASFRRALSKQFRQVAEARLLRGGAVIDSVRQQIERAIRSADQGDLPKKYLTVRPYGRTHSVLLEYLSGRLARPVPASRLRVLTGDQIHTERRVRELRDLGLDVSWHKVADEDQYVLKSLEIDMRYAGKCQVERSIRADRSLDEAGAKRLLTAVPRFLSRMPA
jgi:hypothetical protein